jgi:acetyl-CoA C-acetyltransferase
MLFIDRTAGTVSPRPITLNKDEGNRPETTLAGQVELKPVFAAGQVVKQGKYITAGNALRLSDGASAALLMEAKEAERRGLHPLGFYRGMAVSGCAPDEMGIGPVFAVPRLLARHEAGALWTRTRCDHQTHAANRSFNDDDHRFAGPCL